MTSLGFDTRGIDGALGVAVAADDRRMAKSSWPACNGLHTAPQQQALLREGAPAIQKYDEAMKKADEERKRADAAPRHRSVTRRAAGTARRECGRRHVPRHSRPPHRVFECDFLSLRFDRCALRLLRWWDYRRGEEDLGGRLQSRRAELLPLLASPRNQRRSHRPDRGNSWLAERSSGRDATLAQIAARLARCLISTRWIVSTSSSAASPETPWPRTHGISRAEVPCATTPVQGLPFQKCLISNIRTFRVGTVQAWR